MPSGPARWEIISLELDAVALERPEGPINTLQPHDMPGGAVDIFGGQAPTGMASTLGAG